MMASPLTDFPVAEYLDRVRRVQALMGERGLDAILVSEPSNYRYFAGWDQPFGAPWNGYILTRPFLCVIPRNGDAVTLVHASFEKAANRCTWISDVRAWSSLPFRGDYIADLLKSMGLGGRAQIGLELGEEQRIGFPVQAFLDMSRDLPNTKFVDCADILWRLRLKKSLAEIECVRKACSILHEAYEKMFATVKPGSTEKDVDFHLRRNMTVEGGQGPNFAFPAIFPGGVIAQTPSDRALQAGDVLWIDAGAVYMGYRSDFSRMGVVGKPAAEVQETYTAVREITAATISGIRPGMTATEVTQLCNKESEKRGMPPKAAGRIGHGIGLTSGEPPSIMVGDDTVLEPGMVFTVEPGVLRDYGYFVLEEIVAVTESGVDVLTSRSKPEPYRIG